MPGTTGCRSGVGVTTTTTVMSRCPHVVLMGCGDEELGSMGLVVGGVGGGDDQKCHDCGTKKHLWACLRAQCGYVGCGGESARHSSVHAVRSHHPLAVNLNTRLVWCELCESRVHLDHNVPTPPLSRARTRALLTSPRHRGCRRSLVTDHDDNDDERDPSIHDDDDDDSPLSSSTTTCCDDFELIAYLDQENGKGALSLSSTHHPKID